MKTRCRLNKEDDGTFWKFARFIGSFMLLIFRVSLAQLLHIIAINEDIKENTFRRKQVIKQARKNCVKCGFDILHTPVPSSYWDKVRRVWNGEDLFKSVAWS
jgi:hypothetical protein